MRLAVITHEPFYPPSGGGSAEVVYLVRELVRRGHEVHVFAPSAQPTAPLERRFRIRLHAFTGWKMARRTRWRTLKYLLYPGRIRRQVIAAHTRHPFALIFGQHSIANVAAARLKRDLGVPVVLNFLDFLSGYLEAWPRWLVPGPLLRRLQRFELSLPKRFGVDGVLTISKVLSARFEAQGFPAAKMRSIDYGFEPASFPFSTSAQDVQARPLLVMHGSFDRHHLGPLAEQSLLHLLQARPELRFRFVGPATPSLRRLLRKLRRRFPQADLEVTGFVPYHQIAERLRGAALGIIPYGDCQGTHSTLLSKGIEYLALGIPFVCTRLRGMQRGLGSRPGVHFCDFDPQALAQAVLGQLAAAPQLELEVSSRWAHQHLAWDVVARRAIDFVEDTASVPLAHSRGKVTSVVPAGSS